MSLYYILNTDDYKGKTEQIGDIMASFSSLLYDKTGLSLASYFGLTNEELQDYFDGQGLEYVTEEVLWINLTDEERGEKVLQYIDKITKKEKEELIVIDPYLFRTPKENEERILLSIFGKCKYKRILALVDEKNTNKEYVRRLSRNLDCELKVVYTDLFHDRFWISNRKNGFLMGSSLSGVGKKYCLIQLIEKDDVENIIKIIDDLADK